MKSDQEPSYDDVEPEDVQWTPDDIYRLFDSGMNKTDVAIALGITGTTVRYHLQAREGKRTILPGAVTRERRLQRWGR